MGSVTVQFRVTIESEDYPPDSAFDFAGCEDLIAEISKRLDQGDLWAWCYVTVTATIEGCPMSGRASLGGCSYDGEEDFKKPGGYYFDLCLEAKADLFSKIRAVQALDLDSVGDALKAGEKAANS